MSRRLTQAGGRSVGRVAAAALFAAACAALQGCGAGGDASDGAPVQTASPPSPSASSPAGPSAGASSPVASTPAASAAGPSTPAASAPGPAPSGLVAAARLPADRGYVLPADVAAVNVREHGAKGDGITDDTAAIRRAIAATFNAWEQVYFPAGTYLVSGEIGWERFLTLRGDGPGRTTIRLKDSQPAYADPARPLAVLFCRLYGKGPGHNNESHSNHVLDMTIDVGAGNPGAIGIDFTSHNGGGIENVTVRAAPGSGLTGLSLERDGPGPALVQQVLVDGFDTGIAVRWGVYAMTFDHVTVRNQRNVGFVSDSHNASLNRFTSHNSVPALRVAGDSAYGLLVLVDALLRGGAPDRDAIEVGAEFIGMGVQTEGYRSAVRLPDGSRRTSPVDVVSTSALVGREGRPVTTAVAAIPEPPAVPVETDSRRWTRVIDFARGGTDTDWQPAIQAAIDSGARTLVFHNSTHAVYRVERDIVVRGNVRHIVGLNARFEGTGRVIVDTPEPVLLEQLRADNGFVFRGRGGAILKRALGGTLVKSAGSGDLFVDDWCCGGLDMDGGRAVFRQFNEESEHTARATKIVVRGGGHLTILGLKTEQFGRIADVAGDSRLDVLGGLLYPSQAGAGPTTEMYRLGTQTRALLLHRELATPYPRFGVIGGTDIDPPFPRGVRFAQ